MRIPFLLLACAPLVWSSDFAGTWKRDDSKTRISPAVTLNIETSGGGLHAQWSTGPAFDIIMDGKEHPIPGAGIFDHATYRRVDSHTLEQEGTRAGAPAGKIVWTVSKDGKELHQLSEGTYANGSPYHTDSYMKRIGTDSGKDPLAGKWEAEPARSKFGVPVIYTIKDQDNGLDVKFSNGVTFSCKLDGKECPAITATGSATVTVTKIDDHTIRLALKSKNGTVRNSTFVASGRNLTETTDINGPGGAPLQGIMVFDRQ